MKLICNKVSRNKSRSVVKKPFIPIGHKSRQGAFAPGLAMHSPVQVSPGGFRPRSRYAGRVGFHMGRDGGFGRGVARRGAGSVADGLSLCEP